MGGSNDLNGGSRVGGVERVVFLEIMREMLKIGLILHNSRVCACKNPGKPYNTVFYGN